MVRCVDAFLVGGFSLYETVVCLGCEEILQKHLLVMGCMAALETGL